MNNSYRLSGIHLITLIFSFLIVGGSTSFAQVPNDTKTNGPGIVIEKTNWSGTMECFTDPGATPSNPHPDTFQCVRLWSDNILSFKLIARVAYPDVSLCSPMYFYYLMPNNFPINPTHPSVPNAPGYPTSGIVGPVTNDMLEPIILEDGSEGWQAVFPFFIDLSDYCDQPNNPDQFYFEVSYRLVFYPEPGNSTWAPYITSECPDLFPPDIFHISSTGAAEHHTEGKIICCYDGTYPCEPEFSGGNNNNLIFDPKEEDLSTPQSSAAQFSSVSVSPNPFSDELRFDFENIPENEPIELTIFNGFGKIVKKVNYGQSKFGNFKESINISELPSGVYYFKFLIGEKEFVSKSIKR